MMKRQERKLKIFLLFKEKMKILPFYNITDNFFVHLHQRWLTILHQKPVSHQTLILILKLIQQSITLTFKINLDISYKENNL